MSYTLDFDLGLGPGKAGLTDLRAQLVDTSGVDVGSAVSTGFTEIGNGYYLWHYGNFPDSHRGGIKFYSNATPSTILGFLAINPEEAENTDVKSSVVDDNVWTVGTRTITGGTVTTVGDKTGYSLSSAGIQAIWDALTSALTTVGSIGKRLADNIDAAITSRSSHTAAQAADAVWDEARGDHATAGTFGQGVASVQGDVTGSVASVTGNVGGNVGGSVASVTGSVASVTGNVGGNVVGSIGSLAAQAKTDVNAEADTALADAGLTTTITSRIDTTISSRSSHSAADVWSSGTRTLTSFGTLIADIWSYVTRTLTSGSVSVDPATVWNYATRTLTQSAAAVQAAVTGSDLVITRDVTFDGVQLTGITPPASWTKCYFTVKRDLRNDADTASIIQIRVTNGGAGDDGLLRLNGAAGTAAQGSLSVGVSSVTITLSDDATAQLSNATGLQYDVKFYVSTGSKTVLGAQGECEIALTATRAIS